MIASITPVVLSGGKGSRLWPLSRRLRPKQFLDVYGQASLFTQTIERVSGPLFGAPQIICNQEHRFLVAEELRRLEVLPRDIILEPAPRSTAPAVAVAALKLLADNVDTIMLVLPSDHIIENRDLFHEAIAAAANLSQESLLVTFGIPPDRAEAGYGYICCGEPLDKTGWRVSSFIEKPDRTTAERYVADGGYFWNAGIFVFSAQTFLDELELHHPEIVAAASMALHAGQPDLNFFRLDKSAFEAAPAISLDYAIMEKTKRAAMVPLKTAWSDVGSWSSLSDLGEADENGNVIQGRSVLLDARNNYIRSEKPLIAALGVEGLIVVATDDTVLVLPKDRAQDIRPLVAEIEASGHKEAISHTSVYRPWGHYQDLDRGDGFLVKRIVVNPLAKLSLQYHRHRAEHWTIIAGTAWVTNGEDSFELSPDQSTYIPLGAVHRLENIGEEPLTLIEVQLGSYIGEDDITRLEDSYGRSKFA